MIIVIKQDNKITSNFKLKWSYLKEDELNYILKCDYTDKWRYEIDELLNNLDVFKGMVYSEFDGFLITFPKKELVNFNDLIDKLFDI